MLTALKLIPGKMHMIHFSWRSELRTFPNSTGPNIFLPKSRKKMAEINNAVRSIIPKGSEE